MESETTYQTSPSRKVVGIGPSIGKYLDKNIPAWIETGDGVHHEYSRVLAPNEFEKLAPMESVIHPGLVYQLAD